MNIIKVISHPEVVFHLLFDNYGNYVLQKALAFSRDPYYSILVRSTAPYMEKLKFHHPFGNKLYVKLMNTYPELSNLTDSMTNVNFSQTQSQSQSQSNEYDYQRGNHYVNNVNTTVNNNVKRMNRRNINISEIPRNSQRTNKFTSNPYQ